MSLAFEAFWFRNGATYRKSKALDGMEAQIVGLNPPQTNRLSLPNFYMGHKV